nr:hypothetical protein [Tanacetum cinerariifolium]
MRIGALRLPDFRIRVRRPEAVDS